jgi:hypothetical protein
MEEQQFASLRMEVERAGETNGRDRRISLERASARGERSGCIKPIDVTAARRVGYAAAAPSVPTVP